MVSHPTDWPAPKGEATPHFSPGAPDGSLPPPGISLKSHKRPDAQDTFALNDPNVPSPACEIEITTTLDGIGVAGLDRAQVMQYSFVGSI